VQMELFQQGSFRAGTPSFQFVEKLSERTGRRSHC